jgi:hypothetical protein
MSLVNVLSGVEFLSNGLRVLEKLPRVLLPLVGSYNLPFYRPRERRRVTRVKGRMKGKEEREKQRRRGP